MQMMQEAQITLVDSQKNQDITQELKNTFRRNRYASFPKFFDCLFFSNTSTFENFTKF
jgi:hypothetical protein